MFTKSGYGYGVSGLFRDYLVETGRFTFAEAEAMSIRFDRQITEADWLSTYNGTQFDKVFIPQEEGT